MTGDCTFAYLHRIIRDVMGWDDSHPHDFVFQKQRIGQVPEDDSWFGPDFDEEDLCLGDLLVRAKQKPRYTYDFGDNWRHDIVVESITPLESGTAEDFPCCTAGKRACPPDDCGGMWGYYNMLEILEHPEHEDHSMWRGYVGEGFDPGSFDIEAANARLRR